LYAERFVQRIVLAAQSLKSFPSVGRPVPEADRDDVREILFQDYRIIYRIKPKWAEVLAVIHGRRDLANSDNKPWEVD
jgi:plasmid stabilization system protein ParE